MSIQLIFTYVNTVNFHIFKHVAQQVEYN